jgi:hypothetical protein
MLRANVTGHKRFHPFLLDFDQVTNPPFLNEFGWQTADGSNWWYRTGLDVTVPQGVWYQNTLNALTFTQNLGNPYGGVFYNFSFRSLLSDKIPQ